MQTVAPAFGFRLTVRFLLAGCLAAFLAGCADSERLADPFSNPFRGDIDKTPTASIGAPTGSVKSRPLAAPAQSQPVAAYTAPAYPSEHFAATSARRDPANLAGRTAEGGTPIVMAQGESAGIIAQRYGIPVAALLKTNGFTSSAQVHPGARLIIPTYNAALAASSGVRFASRDIGTSGTRLRFVKGPQPKKLLTAERAHSKKLAQLKAEKAERSVRLAKLQHERAEADAAKERTIVAATEARPKRPAIELNIRSRACGTSRCARISLAGTWPDHSSL